MGTKSWIETASDEEIIEHLLKNKHYYISYDARSENIRYLKKYKPQVYRRWETILLLMQDTIAVDGLCVCGYITGASKQAERMDITMTNLLASDVDVSWGNIEEILDLDDDRETFDKLCSQSLPSDFYVAVDVDKMVYLTPCAYFDREGYAFDQHMDLADILPEYVAENDEMEGVWMCEQDTSPATAKEVLDDLVSVGFKTNADFTDLCGGVQSNEKSIHVCNHVYYNRCLCHE